MHVRHARGSLVAIAALLLLGACSTTTAPGDSAPGPSSARGPAATGTTGGATGATGDASAAAPAGGDPTTNACGLLTVDEIKQATGLTVNPGVLQNSDNQSDCEWAIAQDDAASVGLTVSKYEDFLWQAGATAGNSKPVSGVGEAAFKGWPTFAALNIKAKGYQVVLAVASFKVTQEVIDNGNLAMAKLVLPRL